MKKNRLTLILVIVLLLASLYLLFFKSSFSTFAGKDNDFAVKDTGNITKIFIANKNNQTVTLTRVNGGTWKVNNHYDVRSDAINLLLYTINSLTVKNIVDDKARNAVIKTLASNAIKVEIYKGDTRIKVYYVGTETPDELGTYMLLVNPYTDENYSKPYIIYIPGFDGFLTTRYFIREDDWRDRTIFQYYPYDIKSISVLYPQADSSFRVNVLGKNQFDIDNPVTGQKITGFDTVSLKQYLTYYQSISWEATALGNKKDSVLKTSPFAIIRVEDVKGNVTTLKLFHRQATDKQQEKYGVNYKYDPDRMFAYINDRDFVIAQFFVLGKLLQTQKYFLPHYNRYVEKK